VQFDEATRWGVSPIWIAFIEVPWKCEVRCKSGKRFVGRYW